MDQVDRWQAIREFRRCALALMTNEDPAKTIGIKYSLQMAVAECQLLGIDPSRITPDGYD